MLVDPKVRCTILPVLKGVNVLKGVSFHCQNIDHQHEIYQFLPLINQRSSINVLKGISFQCQNNDQVNIKYNINFYLY